MATPTAQTMPSIGNIADLDGNIRNGVYSALQALHAGAGADVVQRLLDGLAPFHPQEVQYVMNATVDPVIRKYMSATATN
jgi:hypothetical protein